MMKELIYELSRGVAYRKIKHPAFKKYTVFLPLITYVTLLTAYYLLPIKPNLLGKEGLISSALSMLSTLPGFYFAGLAAVSTFGGRGMDVELEAALEVDIFIRGGKVPIKLTKRQFLSYLFSYLVIISFILCFGLLLLTALDKSINFWHTEVIKYAYGVEVWALGEFVVGSFFTLVFASMAITTLHGIFFLTERIHQP